MFILLKHYPSSGYSLYICFFGPLFQSSILRVFHYKHLSYLNILNHTFKKCHIWLLTVMTVTGMTNYMLNQTFFVFWKQNLENVYSIILRPIILFHCLDFLFAAFCFFIERCVTWITYFLSYLLLTVVKYFKFTLKHTFSKIY